MLTRETFIGPWAGLPVAWTDDDQFDEETYRSDVARCCEVGAPGIYTGGTTGEFYALEYPEFQTIARVTVEEGHKHDTPVMIGCTSTSTRGAALRAAYAAEVGADAIQVALPFWMEVADDQVVPFFKAVVDASGGLPLSIYETNRAKKALTIDQHREIKSSVPSYTMVKANAGTVGCTPEGCVELSKFVNVFVGENELSKLGRLGAKGCCSSIIYWNPYVIMPLWRLVQQESWAEADSICNKLDDAIAYLGVAFKGKGYTDTAFDRMGGNVAGFLKTSLRSQGPYAGSTQEDVEVMRRWYREHFPEMLQLG